MGLQVHEVLMRQICNRTQAAALDRFVACAASGDGAPWYIPTADANAQGGYAVRVEWCDPDGDQRLSGEIKDLPSRA